jgi:hypothetical protein
VAASPDRDSTSIGMRRDEEKSNEMNDTTTATSRRGTGSEMPIDIVNHIETDIIGVKNSALLWAMILHMV